MGDEKEASSDEDSSVEPPEETDVEERSAGDEESDVPSLGEGAAIGITIFYKNVPGAA